MNQGKYVFSQITEFIPQRYFERIMAKHKDRTKQWSLTSWNQMLVLMFGQLDACNSLRELTDITTAHAKNPTTLVLAGHRFVCLQTNVYQYGLSVLFYKNSEIVSYFCFLSPHYFVRGRLKTKIFSQ